MENKKYYTEEQKQTAHELLKLVHMEHNNILSWKDAQESPNIIHLLIHAGIITLWYDGNYRLTTLGHLIMEELEPGEHLQHNTTKPQYIKNPDHLCPYCGSLPEYYGTWAEYSKCSNNECILSEEKYKIPTSLWKLYQPR